MKHEALLEKCLDTLYALMEGNTVATGQAIARRMDLTPSPHILEALWELSERGYVRATPLVHRGAVPVKWKFELTNSGIVQAEIGLEIALRKAER